MIGQRRLGDALGSHFHHFVPMKHLDGGIGEHFTKMPSQLVGLALTEFRVAASPMPSQRDCLTLD